MTQVLVVRGDAMRSIMTPGTSAPVPSGCTAVAHNLIKSLGQPCKMVKDYPQALDLGTSQGWVQFYES